MSRALARGERALAEFVFGAALDPDRIRVHARPLHPLQPLGMAIAPNGTIFFHDVDHLSDFAVGPLRTQAWFVHELVHCLQWQRGTTVWLRGLVDRRYRYRLRPGRRFEDYGIEQQAELVRHAFLCSQGSPGVALGPGEAYAALLPFESPLRHALAGSERATWWACPRSDAMAPKNPARETELPPQPQREDDLRNRGQIHSDVDGDVRDDSSSNGNRSDVA